MAQANLALAQEAVENARTSYQKTLMALDMLVGRYPVGTALKSQALPGIPNAYAKGLPSELLERRPDILAAALRLDAARLNIDEAKTARLPKISLSAGFGLIKSSVFVLSTSAANPSLGIGLDVPLFTAGALDQKVKMREAEMDLAYANYAKIGLAAFNEVETALLLEKNWRVRSAELEKAYAIQVLQLSSLEKEQKIGRIDGRAIEQQKATVLGALSKLEQSKLEILVQRINVYLALGGPVQLIEKEKK
jgi:outer membrane protein TolC